MGFDQALLGGHGNRGLHAYAIPLGATRGIRHPGSGHANYESVADRKVLHHVPRTCRARPDDSGAVLIDQHEGELLGGRGGVGAG